MVLTKEAGRGPPTERRVDVGVFNCSREPGVGQKANHGLPSHIYDGCIAIISPADSICRTRHDLPDDQVKHIGPHCYLAHELSRDVIALLMTHKVHASFPSGLLKALVYEPIFVGVGHSFAYLVVTTHSPCHLF